MEDSSDLENISVVVEDIKSLSTAREARGCSADIGDYDGAENYDGEFGCNEEVKHRPPTKKAPNDCNKPPNGDILMLTETDIPGASLNGKSPNQLTVVQLKRWLVCRGAPISGKKSDLIERVQCYINYGWDQHLVDPDKEANSRKKLAAAVDDPQSLPSRLLHSVPAADDTLWTSRLYKIPKITFSTIYDFLVDRKVLLRRVSCLEGIADKRAEIISTNCKQDKSKLIPSPDEQPAVQSDYVYVPVEYTRTLDKAYRFYKDGHVQNIKYHPMPSAFGYVCISATVLPSMRKDRIYHVAIVIDESSAHVVTACYACPAGLSGCCNHVTATLYCLEDYIHCGLQEDEQRGCTERLQVWNQPRKRNVEPRPIDDVCLSKEEYGVQKRLKIHHVNKWNCRPLSRRIIDPNKVRILKERLFAIEQNKILSVNNAVQVAKTPAERKKATEARSLLMKYGSSCFLQLFDDEPPPLESHFDQVKKERVARAAAQKKFQDDLAAQVVHVKHDHCYTHERSDANDIEEKESVVPPHLTNVLYRSHVF
ncbi:uncharacterized protein [Dysidea avara]|uniref:uncharacterized protein n=1 Tax=Dysidea avara TaxID=196820 RepID=UPI00331BA99C